MNKTSAQDRRATVTTNVLFVAVLPKRANPIWKSDHRFGEDAILAERVGSKLQEVAVPAAAVVAFDDRLRDEVTDLVGILAAQLPGASMGQSAIKFIGNRRVVAFVWRNLRQLNDLQSAAAEDAAYGPKLLPFALLRDFIPGAGKLYDAEVGSEIEKLLPETNREFDLQKDPLQRLFSDLPEDYAACYDMLIAKSHAFRSEAARALESRLRVYVQSIAQDTYDEKRALASWLNAQLHTLNLALRCPKTGRPAILVVDLQGESIDTARFRMDVRDDSGRKIRTVTSRTLPEIELMEDVPRPEPFAKHLNVSTKLKSGRRNR